MRFTDLMTPLSRLIRPEPASAADQAAEAAALDSASPQPAARQLQDGETLRRLAGLIGGASPAVPPDVERIAQERVAQLIDTGAMDFAALCTEPFNPSAVLSVAGLCSNPARLPQALALIQDPQAVAALAIDGATSRLRQLAAQRVEDPAALKHILKQVRVKDKNVYKIIKQKLDVQHAEEQRIAKLERDIEALCESLERHSHRIYDVLYPTSLKLFEEEWRTLEAQAKPEMRDRALRAIARCREVIAAHTRRLEEEAAQATHLAALQTARQEAAARSAEQAELLRQESALASAAAAQARELEEKLRADRMAAEALALRQIGGLIGKANADIRDGNTRRAAALRRALEEKLAAAAAVPAHIANQVQQLDAKLNELKEWKDYAVAPKRAELIEEMEALIGSSEAPKVLADRIKALQEDWKTISKGVVSDSEADWQRFHQASQTAYLPCREYFEAQARQRQANLEKRRGVLERLRAFETAQSGEHPDWRAVGVVLREAPQEWRRYFPIDRQAGLALQEEFDASIGRLQARLDAWHAQNLADKKSLIQRAQQLRDKEGHDAVDAVKRLQLLWKDVGPVPRDQEQQLWGEFREHCDAVYQKRQHAMAEYAAGLEANKRQGVSLCEEAEQAAALTGPALLEVAGKIAPWRTAFEALGEMPRADQRALHDRFERAVERCRSRVAEQRTRDKELSYRNLLEAARHIRAYAWSVLQDGASTERDALKHSAETFIAAVESWPKGSRQALDQSWAKAHAATDPDAAANEKALRLLCIRSEILIDRASPPEDQALRREYQVQRLVRHMGQGPEADPDELDALTLEWIRVGPVEPAVHQSLLARFLGCR
jgi:Domain of Unknown Function (DUF349)